MTCNSTISVFDLLGDSLHTRQAVTQLLHNVAQNPCAHIELDFAEVEYISRSFADQFHAEKLALATRQQKSIIVTNANDQIIRMLQAVAKTQDVKDRLYEKMPVFHYTNWRSLENFLLSV